ncbi:hypothetical protein BHE74_00045977 [Ensete ventricosum]|nr:hypothetical protein BHE74_00045977 [Ensete ventricosum]RZS13143.1 hypothetical protein BHM03_00044672 [Ensete ventricosum]
MEEKSSAPRSQKLVGECEFARWDVSHSYCSVGPLATLGPPSSVKNIIELCVVSVESAWLGSTRMYKLVRVNL